MTIHNHSLFSFKNGELHTTAFLKSELYIVFTVKKFEFWTFFRLSLCVTDIQPTKLCEMYHLRSLLILNFEAL